MVQIYFRNTHHAMGINTLF